MLKNRIIPVQLLLNGRLVKSKQFGQFRDVGDPVKSSAVYNSQFADELILLNIDRENKDISSMVEALKEISKVCFMPLAVGGGITKFEHAAMLINAGADKVIINSAAYQDKRLITKIASVLGRQAVVVAIDVLHQGEEVFELYSNNASQKESVDLEAHIDEVVKAGAGEIFIQSIDRDGMMAGFDIPLIKRVASCVDCPVIACGGSGNYEHLKEVFIETDARAVACGSIFNFSDSNLLRAKAFLKNYQLPFKEV